MAAAFLDPRSDQDKRDWLGIISHVCRELKGTRFASPIPFKHRRYCKGIGAGKNRRIDANAEREKFVADMSEDKHIKGLLYSVANGTEYDEREILQLNTFWFERPLHRFAQLQDCMTHTFNYAFRHPIFVAREQVHRLYL